MNDKKLLGLAAKAAGIELEWGEVFNVGEDEVDCSDLPYARGDSPDVGPAYWNPLEDDGDSMRLAVKLDLFYDQSFWERNRADYCAAADAGDHQNPYAATRRAIVRAAAEIWLARQPASE